MKRTWTTVGKEHTEGKKKELGEIFDRMEWHSLPHSMGMGPGMGIKEAIKQLRIPKVSQVSASNELAPYGLLGIKASYANGDATIYLVDEGTGVVPIATDFYPKESGSRGPKRKSKSRKHSSASTGVKGLRW